TGVQTCALPISSPRWIRLSMAAAILASIGLVVALLPWHALWRPAASGKSRPSSEIVLVPTPAPPLQPQSSSALPAARQEQKPAEKSGVEPQFSAPASG